MPSMPAESKRKIGSGLRGGTETQPTDKETTQAAAISKIESLEAFMMCRPFSQVLHQAATFL